MIPDKFFPQILLIFLFSLQGNMILGQAVNLASLKNIEAEIRKLEKLSPSAKISFSLQNEAGKNLYRHQANEKRVPASTLKIFTTGAAMALLGENFRFKTYLEYDGFIDPCGTLTGNLYIRGTGDPTLGSERVKETVDSGVLLNLLADQVKSAGIVEINGNIIGDNSFFLDCLVPGSWLYKDRANYFGASPSGLSFNENYYKVIFKPGTSLGSNTEIIATDPPDIPGLVLKNKVTTNRPNTGDQAVIMEDSIHPGLEKEIIGTIPSGVKSFAIRGSLPDPAQLVAQLLREKLFTSGIEVTGKSYSAFSNPLPSFKRYRNLIYTHYSPNLTDIVKHINYRSHNLFAETMVITLGKEFRGVGNYENGLQVIFDYWHGKGINMQSAKIYDGSGLSPLNQISTTILTQMLAVTQNDPSFKTFLETLPVAGVSGTVRSFCSATTAKGKVFVKSGSIEEVRSYAGYARSKSGKLLPFSIIVNGYKGSGATLTASLEKIMVHMTNLP
jgi:serine-type D-Ala-D-Ala carboxypeptidase/endopeptidase (penicillin-binding protein 4)